MQTLDATTAITAGGWDPRYAVLLALRIEGDVAAALVDSNGDGGDIDLDLWTRDADGAWRERSSSGGAGDEGTGWSPEMVTAYGRTEPHGTIHVAYAGTEHVLTADALGWWLFVAPSVDEGTFPTSVYGDYPW